MTNTTAPIAPRTNVRTPPTPDDYELISPEATDVDDARQGVARGRSDDRPERRKQSRISNLLPVG
jgi:hypothetical protein